MEKIKVKSAIIILVCLWLLFGLTNLLVSVSAENIPLSSSKVEKIGRGKIRLESGIGVIVFDMSKENTKNVLRGDGYLTMSNTFNDSFGFTCKLITVLSTVDLDLDGNCRIHPKINPVIVFKPLPDSSFVTLEDTHAVIQPYSIYNFRYEIRLPVDKVLNEREGYLFYINIGKDLSNASGMNIAINYNYKIFLIFTNVEKQSSLSWLYFVIPPGVVFCTIMIFKHRNHKKPSRKKDKTLEHIIKKPVHRVVDPVVSVEPIADDRDIHDSIDELLKKSSFDKEADGL